MLCSSRESGYMRVPEADIVLLPNSSWQNSVNGQPATVRTPLKKCSLTADDGASSPAEWCTHFGEMVHGGRGRGAPGHHAGNYSGMPLRLRMDSPSIWMV